MRDRLEIVPTQDGEDGKFDVVTVREFRNSPPEVWKVHYSNLCWTGAQDALEHLQNYSFYKM